MRKWLFGAAIAVALLAVGVAVSPWPGVLIIRTIFDRGAAEASASLQPLVPASVTTSSHRYDDFDKNAMLDIHLPPSTDESRPVVVWIHGGGFVSGQRGDITNYAMILAGQGFAVVNVDYTIAPDATYPEPIRQVLKALAFLEREAETTALSSRRFVLAGDSAGAQIAAQTVAVIANPTYARLVGVKPEIDPELIAGALLNCGVYDIGDMGKGGGLLGWFVSTAGWAYSGKRSWQRDEQFQTMSITPHLTNTFPPAFISAGNADPLRLQSASLAKHLEKVGVSVETLFFPADYEPPLGHEYQFNLDSEAGKLALARSAEWLRQLP